jgi:hypothetical protein
MVTMGQTQIPVPMVSGFGSGAECAIGGKPTPDTALPTRRLIPVPLRRVRFPR